MSNRLKPLNYLISDPPPLSYFNNFADFKSFIWRWWLFRWCRIFDVFIIFDVPVNWRKSHCECWFTLHCLNKFKYLLIEENRFVSNDRPDQVQAKWVDFDGTQMAKLIIFWAESAYVGGNVIEIEGLLFPFFPSSDVTRALKNFQL